MICLAIEKLKSKLPPSKDEYRMSKSYDYIYNTSLGFISLAAIASFAFYYLISFSKFNFTQLSTNYSLIISFLLLTIILLFSWILYTRRKKNTEKYRLIFGFNAIIERGKSRNDSVIEYNQIKRIIRTENGIIIENKNESQSIFISNLINKYAEVKERIESIRPLEF